MLESETKQPQTAMLSRKQSKSKFDIPQHFKDSLSECSRRLVEGNDKWNIDISFSDEDEEEDGKDSKAYSTQKVATKSKSHFKIKKLINSVKVQ